MSEPVPNQNVTERWDARRMVWEPIAPAPSEPAAPVPAVQAAAPAPRRTTIEWPRSLARSYAAGRNDRLTGFATPLNTSSDQELVANIATLRARSRQLVRDHGYAKRAKVVVVNNVIGAGVGLQASVMSTRGDLNERLNDQIEELFEEWSCGEYCHTGGELHFHDLERAGMSEVFEAGEAFFRIHREPFGDSPVPLALELLEAELVADETQPAPLDPQNMVRMGIEVDRFFRPVRYWFRERHMGEFRLGIYRSDRYYSVPAQDIIHLRVIERWPQTRAAPWLHTAIRRLQDMDGYSEAEIVAARAAANYFASIEGSEDPDVPIGEKQSDGSVQATMEPGIILPLGPGEKLNFHAPNRPNAAMDGFMRLMLREVAAGTGASYEALSRDYSQSNYSSARLALLDDRDLWRYYQHWYIRSFRYRLHKEFMNAAVLSRQLPVNLELYANNLRGYQDVRFKPRGWTWIDPTKEVDAYINAVRAGFTTVSDVVSQTGAGRDMEDVLNEREKELKQMHEKGLEFDTDPDRKRDGSLSDPAPKAAPVPNATPQPPTGAAGEKPVTPPAGGRLRVAGE